MKRNRSMYWAFGAAALMLTACAPKEGADLEPWATAVGQFPAYFQEYWKDAEDAAASLPEGTLFFADLDGNSQPELYLTYSTGMGKQTGILAFDLSSEQPELLGSAYLGVAPLDERMEFTRWEEENGAVLHTDGIIPVGAANQMTPHIESFLRLTADGLTVEELHYTVQDTGETIYYSGGEPITEEEYRRLRREQCGDGIGAAVAVSSELNFLEEPEAFVSALQEGCRSWTEV